MTMRLKQLMDAVGCERYPEADMERLFDAAMKKYDAEGCFLADVSYYERLHEKYSCFEKYMDVYRSAAKQITEDENLGRFLTLFTMVIHDEASDMAEWKGIKKPATPQGKEPLGYEMALGLAMCSQLDDMYARLKARKIPDECIFKTMRLAINSVSTHERKHDGEPGFDLFAWCQLYVYGRLFLIERLEVEFLSKFHLRAKVFQNKQGEHVVLAHDLMLHKDGVALGSVHYEETLNAWYAEVEEAEDSYIGYPTLEDGRVSKEKCSLSKAEWTLIVEKDDPIIGLHIPPFGKLNAEDVDKTIGDIREFAAAYFPEYAYKCFACHSWLLDPQLEELVGAESNITKFMKRFTKITDKSQGEDVFNFIFNKPDMNFNIEDLPENTRLHRALKSHYLSGKAVYELKGFFF